MNGIGGNLKAIIQTSTSQKNAIGETVKNWTDRITLTGWLDLSGGTSGYNAYSAKVLESSHVFVCDYVELPSDIKEENCRMVAGGKTYDVMLIDNPMHMGSGSQLEIFLKYTGGV